MKKYQKLEMQKIAEQWPKRKYFGCGYSAKTSHILCAGESDSLENFKLKVDKLTLFCKDKRMKFFQIDSKHYNNIKKFRQDKIRFF